MASLNIRDVPDDMMRRLKSEAALSGMNLRGWVLSTLQASVLALEAYKGAANTLGISESDIQNGRPTEAANANASTPCECPNCLSKRWEEANPTVTTVLLESKI